MTSQNKQGKMTNYVNYRMRATLEDGRQLAGQMLAFDKHMNLVLADTEEFRRIKQRAKKPAAASAPGSAAPAAAEAVEIDEKRTLGLLIVRGAHIVSLTVEGPPPADPSARLGTSAPGPGGPVGGAALAAGPGISRPGGRGAPIGLTGPAPGVGGPAPPGFPGPPGGFGGFPGRGGPLGFAPPGFPTGGPPGFQPPGFQPPGGRGFPGGPPGFGGR